MCGKCAHFPGASPRSYGSSRQRQISTTVFVGMRLSLRWFHTVPCQILQEYLRSTSQSFPSLTNTENRTSPLPTSVARSRLSNAHRSHKLIDACSATSPHEGSHSLFQSHKSSSFAPHQRPENSSAAGRLGIEATLPLLYKVQASNMVKTRSSHPIRSHPSSA